MRANLQWPQAPGLLAFMQTQGLEPSLLGHSADISSCKHGLQWQQAFKLLAEMQA